jgi:hypothetical protein
VRLSNQTSNGDLCSHDERRQVEDLAEDEERLVKISPVNIDAIVRD